MKEIKDRWQNLVTVTEGTLTAAMVITSPATWLSMKIISLTTLEENQKHFVFVIPYLKTLMHTGRKATRS